MLAPNYWRSVASNFSRATASSNASVASMSASVKVRAVSCISTRIARLFLAGCQAGAAVDVEHREWSTHVRRLRGVQRIEQRPARGARRPPPTARSRRTTGMRETGLPTGTRPCGRATCRSSSNTTGARGRSKCRTRRGMQLADPAGRRRRRRSTARRAAGMQRRVRRSPRRERARARPAPRGRPSRRRSRPRASAAPHCSGRRGAEREAADAQGLRVAGAPSRRNSGRSRTRGRALRLAIDVGAQRLDEAGQQRGAHHVEVRGDRIAARATGCRAGIEGRLDVRRRRS